MMRLTQKYRSIAQFQIQLCTRISLFDYYSYTTTQSNVNLDYMILFGYGDGAKRLVAALSYYGKHLYYIRYLRCQDTVLN